MNKKKNNFIFISLLTLIVLIIVLLFKSLFSLDETINIYMYVIIYFIITMFFVIKERKNIINIKTIFVALFTIMIGLSPLFYFLNKKSVYANTGNSLEYQYIWIIIAYLFLIIGFYLVPSNKKERRLKEQKELEKKYLSYSYFFSLILLIISTAFNLYYIFVNRALLFGGNLESNRITSMASSGLMLLIGGLNVPAIGLLYNYYEETKRKKFLLFISIIITILLYIIRGSRTPIIRIALIIILIRNAKRPIKPENMLKLAAIAILGLAGLQILRTSMSGGNTELTKEMYSILQVGSINLNYVYRTFPTRIPFQYGYTYIINILMLLPGEDVDFTLWLKNSIGISFDGGGVTPTIIGEGYINFGIPGIIISMIIIGIIGKILNEKYINNNYNNIVWTSWMIAILVDVFRGGFANVEVNILTFIFIYALYKILLKKEKN